MLKAFKQPAQPGLLAKTSTAIADAFRTSWRGLTWFGWKKEVTKYLEQPSLLGDPEPGPVSRRHPWTYTHSLYATMGGFVIDTRNLDQSYLLKEKQRMTLSLKGLVFLVEHNPDLIPDISESEIRDKSKANSFTKTVTCVQALWFSIQCLTRLAQGLSISLLEISTAIHAACALVLYFFLWWDKPLDVEEPTICTHVDVHAMAAFMSACDMFPGTPLSRTDREDDGNLDLAPDSGDVIHHPNLKHIVLKPAKDPEYASQGCVVYHGFVFPAFQSRQIGTNWHLNLTELDFKRFSLASEAVRKYKLRLDFPDGLIGSPHAVRYLVARLRNRPAKNIIPQKDNFTIALRIKYRLFCIVTNVFVVGFFLAGLFYGSVHLFVWNRPFRSATERLLWKVSSLTILGSGVLLTLYYCLWQVCIGYMSTGRRAACVGRWGKAALYAVFLLFYLFCRTFIIVECFLDVFHLPDSAFEVPQWSQYFPHIG
jgi:hypothetical protein